MSCMAHARCVRAGFARVRGSHHSSRPLELSNRGYSTHYLREMGGAPRNPAPRKHFSVWIVKPSGCPYTDAFCGQIHRRVPTPLRSTSPLSDYLLPLLLLLLLTYIYIYIYIYMYIYIYIQTYVYTAIQASGCPKSTGRPAVASHGKSVLRRRVGALSTTGAEIIYIYIYTHTSTYTYAYVCMYLSLSIYIYIYIY